MVKVMKSSGKEIRLVQEVEKKVLNDFLKVVNAFTFQNNEITSKLERLGGGACGDVYDFGDYIIKRNKDNGWATMKDGKVLEALQGLPLVPNLYAYTADEGFYLIEKVKGKNVATYTGWCAEPVPAPFEEKTWKEKLEVFFNGAVERGWIPNDMHDYNTMLDEQGNFWVVDFGLFHEASRGGMGDYCDLVSQIESLAENAKKHGKVGA